jgi:hypothetical protein
MKDSMFIKDTEYVFTGFVSSFHADKIEKNMFGHYILGKFLEYKDVPLHVDIIPEAKAVFENGTVDCSQYHNIVSKELSYKKNI